MSGIKFGTDKRGHKYKTDNGKHVPIGNAEPATKDTRSATPYGVRDPINNLMRKWMKGASSPGAAKKAVGQLIKSEFRQWFTITAKTSVGKYGRLYAARMMLKAMKSGQYDEGKLDKDDQTLLQSHTKGGVLDGEGFLKDVEKRLGSDPDDSDADDQAILKLCHSHGIDASTLEHMLKTVSLGDDSDT